MENGCVQSPCLWGPIKHAASMGSWRSIGSSCAPSWNDGLPVRPSALGSMKRRLDWVTTTLAQGSTAMAPERFINWPEVLEAWVQLGEIDPSECVSACLVSTWKLDTRNWYTTHLCQFARIGGFPVGSNPSPSKEGLTFHVHMWLPSGLVTGMRIGTQGGGPTGMGARYKGQDYGQWPKHHRKHRTTDHTEGPMYYNSWVRDAGQWVTGLDFAGAVPSFSTLATVSEIASARRMNLTQLGITFQGLKRGVREVTRRMGTYVPAWSTWLSRIAPGEAQLLGPPSTLQEGMARLLQGTTRHDARWHAWRRAGATYLRALGLPWRYLC